MPLRPPARSILLLALLGAGCSYGPKAPPLAPEAVFQNDRVGVRFLAPEGWSITSRTDIPPGKLPKPIVMVAYVQPVGERPSEFELMAAEFPEGGDVPAFLTGNPVGRDRWTMTGAVEPVTIGGAAATRYLMVMGKGKAETRREVTAFQRDGRLYYFVVTYGASDADHREQVRRSVDSVTWSK